jgi:hypothetical protein
MLQYESSIFFILQYESTLEFYRKKKKKTLKKGKYENNF